MKFEKYSKLWSRRYIRVFKSRWVRFRLYRRACSITLVNLWYIVRVIPRSELNSLILYIENVIHPRNTPRNYIFIAFSSAVCPSQGSHLVYEGFFELYYNPSICKTISYMFKYRDSIVYQQLSPLFVIYT